MKYNIEKINKIGKLLAEIVEEALAGERQEDVRIAEVEMEVRESLREVGRSAMKCYLENADREVEAKIECKCGGKLEYQRRRTATIWLVFGKMSYKERTMQVVSVARDVPS